MRVNVAEPHEPEGGEHENPDPAPKPGPTSPDDARHCQTRDPGTHPGEQVAIAPRQWSRPCPHHRSNEDEREPKRLGVDGVASWGGEESTPSETRQCRSPPCLASFHRTLSQTRDRLRENAA